MPPWVRKITGNRYSHSRKDRISIDGPGLSHGYYDRSKRDPINSIQGSEASLEYGIWKDFQVELTCECSKETCNSPITAGSRVWREGTYFFHARCRDTTSGSKGEFGWIENPDTIMPNATCSQCGKALISLEQAKRRGSFRFLGLALERSDSLWLEYLHEYCTKVKTPEDAINAEPFHLSMVFRKHSDNSREVITEFVDDLTALRRLGFGAEIDPTTGRMNDTSIIASGMSGLTLHDEGDGIGSSSVTLLPRTEEHLQ